MAKSIHRVPDPRSRNRNRNRTHQKHLIHIYTSKTSQSRSIYTKSTQTENHLQTHIKSNLKNPSHPLNFFQQTQYISKSKHLTKPTHTHQRNRSIHKHHENPNRTQTTTPNHNRFSYKTPLNLNSELETNKCSFLFLCLNFRSRVYHCLFENFMYIFGKRRRKGTEISLFFKSKFLVRRDSAATVGRPATVPKTGFL